MGHKVNYTQEHTCPNCGSRTNLMYQELSLNRNVIKLGCECRDCGCAFAFLWRESEDNFLFAGVELSNEH